MTAALAAAYRNAEIETVSQRDLLVRLYQGIERFLDQGEAAMRNQKRELATVSCQKARAILFELLSTLNFEVGGEIAERLKQIYLFLIAEITECSLRKDADRLRKIRPTLAILRSAWEEIPAEFANVTSLTGVDRHSLVDVRS